MNSLVKFLSIPLFSLACLLSGCEICPTCPENTPDTSTAQPAVSCEDFMQLDVLTLLSTDNLKVSNVDLSSVIYTNYCKYHCAVAAAANIDTTGCYVECTNDEAVFKDCSGSTIPFGGAGGDATGANGSDQSSDVGDPQTGIQLSNLKWTSQCLAFTHGGTATEVMVQKLRQFPSSQAETHFWNTVSAISAGHLTIYDPEKEVYVSMMVSTAVCNAEHRFFILVYKDPAVLASSGFRLFLNAN